MFNKKEMRFSGSGGQGVIMAAIIFANAALADGHNAIQTQSYGPEARGGSSKAEVIISSEEIKYPEVINNTFLLSLTQKSFDEYIVELKENGILIIDESVKIGKETESKYRVYRLPILKTASEKIGIPMTANIVSIGAIWEIACQEFIKLDTIKKSISERVPKQTIEKNMTAFDEGRKLAQKYLEI